MSAAAASGGVAVAGNIVADLLARPVAQWKWGATTWVEEVKQSLGGNGASTAFALARLGVPVTLFGWVGGDSLGDFALATLASAGVRTDRIVRSSGPNATTIALVHPDGERAFLHAPGASLVAFPEPLEFTPGEFHHFHLANVFGIPNLRRHGAAMLARARSAGMRTSLDTGWDARGVWLPDVKDCLALTDILFVNETEAQMLSGQAQALDAVHFFQDCGAGTVIVKQGARGCLAATAGEISPAPAGPVQVVDTTGAGDCFAGGFLAALERGFGMLPAARIANAVAALSVSALGATTGLRSWEETLAFLAGSQPE